MPFANTITSGQYPNSVDQLITSVRRRAFMPPDGDGSDTASLLQLANESLPWLVAEIMKFRQGHFRQSVDLTLVAGQTDYIIPIRAAGGNLDTIIPIDPLGNPVDLPLLEDDVEMGGTYQQQSLSNYPQRYFWKGNSLSVAPTPTGTGVNLRIFYPRRPSQLVLLASAYRVYVAPAQVGPNWTVGIAPITSGLSSNPTTQYLPSTNNPVPLSTPSLFAINPGISMDFIKSTGSYDVVATATTTNQSSPSSVLFVAAGGSGATFGAPVLGVDGSITSVPVTSGGSGYTQGAAITVTDYAGSGYNANLTANVSAGAVTSVQVLNGGLAYGQGITLTFAGTAPTSFGVGDYCSFADTAPVVTWVMPEAFPVFAQYCAMRLLETRKNPQDYQTAKDALAVEEAQFTRLIATSRTRYQHSKVPGQFGKFRWGGRGRRPYGGWLR